MTQSELYKMLCNYDIKNLEKEIFIKLAIIWADDKNSKAETIGEYIKELAKEYTENVLVS